MLAQNSDHNLARVSNRWLKSYYFVRFAVSAVWVALAFTVAKTMPPLAAIMLVAYPAWDALANLVDAQRTGGLSRNKSQLLNFVISLLTALAVAIALTNSNNAVLAVYGVWAVLSGLFQLITAARRWKINGAQWAMILSGAQSALAGVFFVRMAGGVEAIGITNVAPYAAFGAFYFLVSAVWLVVSDILRKSPQIAD
ncbi:DUF308 domain-containing protein [Mesorhizobium sp. M9A.F.Ca.ET.002.03.1.2]|uniref:DUF308 domain-containing protein n=1 Tax=Mesorhizobium sp. M9A.F.Ca.ET.002.03.1.2 TaxID=2493668 RepID=UPI000F7615B6|nr:DUF308 domain-containing protein [Mesorhizobium sp. M9A.F.Ca.ET.002.03.1.2]AZN99941.1 DUF308 domain-containing protein [Mesorhizobium sp. M9A.F.Ca.ET.002.03.1.2]